MAPTSWLAAEAPVLALAPATPAKTDMTSAGSTPRADAETQEHRDHASKFSPPSSSSDWEHITPPLAVRIPSSSLPSTACTPEPGTPELECPLLATRPSDFNLGGVAEQRVYWEGFFVVMPVFCGYATLFGMQHHIKTIFGIQDDGSSASYDFGFAVSTLYACNLLVRFGHKVILSFLSPRGRVFVAMASMAAAMLLIAVLIFVLEVCDLRLVALAYSLGGLAVGTFEANVLGCLTPLGHATKRVAITAIPAGISLVLIGGFFLLGPPLDIPVASIYVVVAALNICGMVVMAMRIPPAAEAAKASASGAFCLEPLRRLAGELRQHRRWLPQVWHYALASMVDMFALSTFAPGVLPYVYDGPFVQLADGVFVKTDTFMAFASIGNLVGGLTGRWLSYRMRPRHPLLYCISSVAGVAVLLTWKPLLAPWGMFLVLVGDGLIYGTVSKHIDTVVPQEFNLIAISTWLFIGDLGAVAGSSLTVRLKEALVG